VLREIRSKRPYPFIDRKLQTSWNALLIHGLFSAAVIDFRYADLALLTLESLYRELYVDGKLYHQKLPDRSPKVPALLEDYSFLIAATLDAYDATQESRWLRRAEGMAKEAKGLFSHKGVWYDSVGEFRNPLNLEGGAYRSPLAVMVDNYLRLAVYSEKLEYQEEAKAILKRGAGILESYPHAAPMGVLSWLAERYGYILVKIPSPEYPMVRRKISRETPYPFLLFKKVEDPLFQACRVDRCFLYDRNGTKFMESLVNKLEKRR